MSKNALTPKGIMPTEIREVLGPAPTRTPEQAKLYEQVLFIFGQRYQPCDLLEWNYISDLAYYWVEIRFYRGLKSALIDRARKQQEEVTLTALTRERDQCMQAEKAAAQAEIADAIAKLKGSPAQVEAQAAPLKLQSQEKLAGEIAAFETDYKKEKRKLEQELASAGEAGCFDQWIGDIERIEPLLLLAEKRFEHQLRELDEYREVLGERLCRDDIVDVPVDETVDGVGAATDDKPAAQEQLIAAPPIDPFEQSGPAEHSEKGMERQETETERQEPERESHQLNGSEQSQQIEPSPMSTPAKAPVTQLSSEQSEIEASAGEPEPMAPATDTAANQIAGAQCPATEPATGVAEVPTGIPIDAEPQPPVTATEEVHQHEEKKQAECAPTDLASITPLGTGDTPQMVGPDLDRAAADGRSIEEPAAAPEPAITAASGGKAIQESATTPELATIAPSDGGSIAPSPEPVVSPAEPAAVALALPQPVAGGSLRWSRSLRLSSEAAALAKPLIRDLRHHLAEVDRALNWAEIPGQDPMSLAPCQDSSSVEKPVLEQVTPPLLEPTASAPAVRQVVAAGSLTWSRSLPHKLNSLVVAANHFVKIRSIFGALLTILKSAEMLGGQPVSNPCA